MGSGLVTTSTDTTPQLLRESLINRAQGSQRFLLRLI